MEWDVGGKRREGGGYEMGVDWERMWEGGVMVILEERGMLG